MINNQDTNHRKFDLEERTTEFAKSVIRLCRSLPKDTINNRLIGQMVGSAGSVGANYREANDALGKKDFRHKLKIARRETKETIHWIELIKEANPDINERQVKSIRQETVELKNIFSAIISKSK